MATSMLRRRIKPLTERVAAAGVFAVLSLLPLRFSTPGNGETARARRAAFPLEGWTYGRIGEAPGTDRYRLRLDVGLRPGRAKEFAQTFAVAGGGEPSLFFPEFRLMLERTGDRDFTCLRCARGRLELVQVARGEFLEPTGRPWASLSFLSEILGPDAKPLTLTFHVDRSPGRWAVSLFGEEVLAVPEVRTPAGEFAWSATPGWRLEARSLQPLGEITFEDAFERESFREDGEYELISGEWKLDSVRDVVRTVNAFRLRGSARGGSPAVATVGHDFWRDYRVEVSIKFPRPGTGGLVFAGRPGRKFGIVRWTCPPADRPSADDADGNGRALLEVLESSPFTPPDWARPLPAEHVERVLVSLPWRPRLEQWYRLAVSVFDETAELDVNGRRHTFRLPAALRSGPCGLYSESAKGVLFDDLLVRSNTEFAYARGDLVAPFDDAPLHDGPGGWARLRRLPEGPVRISVRPARGADALALRWPVEGVGDRLQLVLVRAMGMGTLELEREGGRTVSGYGNFDIPTDLLKREVTVGIADDVCTVLDGGSVIAQTRLPLRRAGPVEILRHSEGGAPAFDRLAVGPLLAPAPIRHKSRAFEEVDVTVNKKGQRYPEMRWGGFVGWIEDRGAWDVPKNTAHFRAPIWGDVDCELRAARPKDGLGVGLYLVPDGRPEEALGVSLVRESDGVAVVDSYGNILGRYRGDEEKLHSTPPEGAPTKRVRRPGRAERERVWIEKRVPGGALVCYLLGRGHEDMRPLHGSLLRGNPGARLAGLALAAENDVRHAPQGARIKNGGKLFSVEAGRRLAERIKQKGVFSLEALLAPADTAHGGPARIVSLSRDGGVRNFTLGQERREWVVRLRTSETNANGTAPELRMGGLRPRRTHVAVTYDGKAVRFYLDGEPKESRKKVRGDLKGWDPGYALVLGNEFAERRDWAGVIRFVAFYDRVLSREEVRAAARDLPPGEAPLRPDRAQGEGPPSRARRIRLRRLADTVEAWVDGETVFAVQIEGTVHGELSPLSGPVRVEARGPGVGPKDITIRAPSVDESLFEAAPTEWIRWRGHCDVTTKWQCDPRWSFIGLWSDAADTTQEAAGLFSRTPYFGDQYLHFNFAFKDMLAGKVNKRRYVRRDLNFAFCCDGEDLASGYCLLFGGFDNRGMQLLRKGRLVAENEKLKFPKFKGNVGDVHWAWYSLEILRRGDAITVLMGGKTVIEWTDPEPIAGGHVAAWVLGGGMILGRTRFSAQRRGEELVAFETGPPPVPPDGWRPLDGDHPVAIIRSTRLGTVRVTNRAGGGHFAAEFSSPRERASLRALAFRADESTRVRARLYAPGREGPAAILPAEKETLPADGEWHVFSLDGLKGGPLGGSKGGPGRVRFGIWKPEGYLAAGIGGNPAGAWYEVKLFPSLDAATRFCRSAAYQDAF